MIPKLEEFTQEVMERRSRLRNASIHPMPGSADAADIGPKDGDDVTIEEPRKSDEAALGEQKKGDEVPAGRKGNFPFTFSGKR